MGLRLLTPPSVEPITLTEAKAHLKFELEDEDELILTLISAARQSIEHATGRALITQTWRLTLDYFPETYIKLPIRPVQSLSAFNYIDSSGLLVDLGSGVPWTLSTDYVLSVGEPPILYTATGEFWPSSLASQYSPVTIDIVAGYGADPTDVPEALRQAAKIVLNDLFENREAQVIGTITSDNPIVKLLLSGYRGWVAA